MAEPNSKKTKRSECIIIYIFVENMMKNTNVYSIRKKEKTKEEIYRIERELQHKVKQFKQNRYASTTYTATLFPDDVISRMKRSTTLLLKLSQLVLNAILIVIRVEIHTRVLSFCNGLVLRRNFPFNRSFIHELSQSLSSLVSCFLTFIHVETTPLIWSHTCDSKFDESVMKTCPPSWILSWIPLCIFILLLSLSHITCHHRIPVYSNQTILIYLRYMRERIAFALFSSNQSLQQQQQQQNHHTIQDTKW